MKPVIPIKVRAVNNPAKNYIFNLLWSDIQALNPARSLDAGTGRMRNFWMFPGKYVGIGNNKNEIVEGLALKDSQEVMRGRDPLEIYVMMLESDFSFLGEFDLCVSTYTLMYTEDRFDVVLRLAERLRRGGPLLFQDVKEHAGRYLDVLAPHFEMIDTVYFGLADTHRFIEPFDREVFQALQQKEMDAPNAPEGHSEVYMRAIGKRTGALPSGPAPEMASEGMVHVVVGDLPAIMRHPSSGAVQEP